MATSRRCDATVISSTAPSNAASCLEEGLLKPLTLRTNWRAAARISSAVATSSAWRRGLMLRHTPATIDGGGAAGAGGGQPRQGGRGQPAPDPTRPAEHRRR